MLKVKWREVSNKPIGQNNGINFLIFDKKHNLILEENGVTFHSLMHEIRKKTHHTLTHKSTFDNSQVSSSTSILPFLSYSVFFLFHTQIKMWSKLSYISLGIVVNRETVFETKPNLVVEVWLPNHC